MSRALNTAPLSAEEFTLLLKDLTPLPSHGSRKIAVAVSGGPDSMALAFCCLRWTQQTGNACVAFIIDHGLRPESASEAVQVKTRLEKLGLHAEILLWQHEPVTNRIHETARAARYALLSEACGRHDISDLFVAHHREDQAETILMRLAKGSGIDGLAGMEAQSERNGIRILRPFLATPKQRLIATCVAANIETVSDPSNQSDKYARGRLRKILPLLEQEGLTIDTLSDLGARASEARDALDHYTKDFLRAAALPEIGGTIRLSRQQLPLVPRAIALRALVYCLRYVHDKAHAPERAGLVDLFDAIMDRSVETTRSFYGCLISIAANDVLILREPAAVTEEADFRPRQVILWDDRWLVTGDGPDALSTLRALGNPPHDVIDLLSPDLRRCIPQGRVRATLPALWLGDELRAIPSFNQDAVLRLKFRKQAFP